MRPKRRMMHGEQLIEDYSNSIGDWIMHVIVQYGPFEGDHHSLWKDSARDRIDIGLRHLCAIDQKRGTLPQDRADLAVFEQLFWSSPRAHGHAHRALSLVIWVSPVSWRRRGTRSSCRAQLLPTSSRWLSVEWLLQQSSFSDASALS